MQYCCAVVRWRKSFPVFALCWLAKLTSSTVSNFPTWGKTRKSMHHRLIAQDHMCNCDHTRGKHLLNIYLTGAGTSGGAKQTRVKALALTCGDSELPSWSGSIPPSLSSPPAPPFDCRHVFSFLDVLALFFKWTEHLAQRSALRPPLPPFLSNQTTFFFATRKNNVLTSRRHHSGATCLLSVCASPDHEFTC